MEPGIDRTDGAAPLPTGVVTFLLTDIVGSTSSWEQHPEAMDAALTSHDAVVQSAVTAHAGHLLKARGEGDSTFSVFARATDAVAAAVALQRGLREQAWPPPLTLWARAGLHTGEAVERDGDYFGTTVNRAARLRSLASGGQVVLSQATAELLGFELPEGVTLEDLGVRPLAGSERPEHVRALHIEGLTLGPTLAPAALDPARALALPSFLATGDDPFVGRVRELAELEIAWADARRGPSRIALVTGEAGIGKSTLVAVLARRVRAAGGLVLAGRCDEGYEVPYQPFIEALDPLVASGFGTTAAALPAQLGGELARILPHAGGHLAVAPPQDADPQTARYRLFEAVAAWLDAVARTTPTLLLLEDVHWAATPTLLLLRHVTRFPIEGLLVVATSRPTDREAPTSVADLLDDVRDGPRADEITLGGLEIDDVAELVRRSVSTTATAADPAAIHARTGGNALFVREVLAAGDPGGSGLSPRMHEIVRRRIRDVSEPCRQLLEAAAVLGNEVALPVLLAMARDGPPEDRDRRLRGIDEAVAARILEPTDPGAGRFRFAHAVVRDAIEDGLGHSRRMQLHLAAARAIAAAPAPSPATLAHHLTAAMPLAPGEALAAATAAADQAMAVSAFEDAVVHGEQALRAADLSGAPVSDRIDLLLGLARAHAGAGHVGDAATTSRQAADLAERAGDAARLTRAALCFEGEIVTGGDFWFSQLALLEEAGGLPPRHDVALHARLLAMLVHVRASMDLGADVDTPSATAVALAEASGDHGAMAAALQSRRHVLAPPEYGPARLALSQQAIEHGQRAGDEVWTMLARLAELADLLELGELAKVDRALGDYIAAARRLRRPHDLWRAEVVQAMLALFRGDLVEGELLTRKAFEVGERLQQPGALQAYVVQTFFLATQRGTVAELIPFAEAWAAQRGSVATWRASLALAYCEAGRTAEAAELLADLAAGGFTAVPQDNLWLATLGMAGEVAWRLGDADRAEPLLGLLSPHADRNVTIGTALAFGAAGRVAGLVAALLGDLDRAVALLEAALARNDEMGSAVWVATTADNLAEVLRRRGRPGDAARADALRSEQARDH